MKPGIHPSYVKEATITCGCGAEWKVGATLDGMHIEICSKCHPFYTGKKKFVDTGGRVDRFKKLAERAGEKRSVHLDTVKIKAAKMAAGKKAESKKEA